MIEMKDVDKGAGITNKQMWANVGTLPHYKGICLGLPIYERMI
jgi:hypothetical protein